MMRVRALSTVVLLLVLAACTPEQSDELSTTSSFLPATAVPIPEKAAEFVDHVSGPEDDGTYADIGRALEVARACWEEKGPDDYHLAVEFGAMAVTEPALARVVADQVIDAYPPTDQWSAEALFDLVEEIVDRRPDAVDVSFDPGTCHVVSIGVDEDTEAVDDEHGYDIHLTADPGFVSDPGLGDGASLPPPVVHLVSGGKTTVLHPYDYCWDATCADSFGAQESDRAEISDASAYLLWRGDGTLSAYVIEESGSATPLTLEEHGPGTWGLAIPTESGKHLFQFHGSTFDGTAMFQVEAVPQQKAKP